MSDIIADPSANPNPTARETLHGRLFQFVGGATADEMLDAYRTEVLAEAADRAEELRQFDASWGARKSAQVSENIGVLRVADELRRMAVDGGESRG